MFYVSTFGGSASRWLSYALSMHPSVVCFHGTRCIPPINMGTEHDMNAEQFAEALATCELSSQYRKSFGSAHGFHGTDIKKAIEARRGNFAAVIREPIRRINSLFLANYKAITEAEIGKPTIYDEISERHVNELLFRVDGNSVSIGNVSKVFLSICDGTLKYDIEIALNCDPTAIFLFEKMTSDREYFANMFHYLMANLETITDSSFEVTDAYLDAVFNVGRYNTHGRSDDLTTVQILAKWPPFFRYLLALTVRNFWEFGGQKLDDFYKSVGYEGFSCFENLDLRGLDHIDDLAKVSSRLALPTAAESVPPKPASAAADQVPAWRTDEQ